MLGLTKIRALVKAAKTPFGQKKNQLFIIEGRRCMEIFLHKAINPHAVYKIFGTDACRAYLAESHPNYQRFYQPLSAEEISRIGHLKNNNFGLILARILPAVSTAAAPQTKGRVLALDGLSNPRNVGAILRLAWWYGIDRVVSFFPAVTFYHPEVIQSSMGSVFLMPHKHVERAAFLLSAQRAAQPILAADLKGSPAHTYDWPTSGILILGNEAHGISPLTAPFVDQSIKIPANRSFDSLNVAVSAGILCDRWLFGASSVVGKKDK